MMAGKLLTAMMVGGLAGLVAWLGLGPIPGLLAYVAVGTLVMIAPPYRDDPPPRCPDWCEATGPHHHVTR